MKRYWIIVIFILMLVYCFSGNQYSHAKNQLPPNGLIIHLTQDITEEALLKLLQNTAPNMKLENKDDQYALLSGCNEKEMPAVSELLLQSELIDIAEPNYFISSESVTNDPYSLSQWSLENRGSYLDLNRDTQPTTQGIDIQTARAWETYPAGKKNNEVIVAMIDTGVDYLHPDLKNNIWINKKELANDGIDNDNNEYIDDRNGWDFIRQAPLSSSEDQTDTNDDHGTHCAGIIAAAANNGIGIAGAASNINVKIMPLKVLQSTSSQNPGTGSIYNAIRAIKYATEKGAKICNMSWGIQKNLTGSNTGLSLLQAIKESDMLFVTVAGNDGKDVDHNPIYPASFQLDNIISVASINPNGDLSKFSNYGKNTITLAAPGENIISTITGSYRFMSGSSMAAPHVTAVAAMLYSSGDYRYAADIKDHIIQTITPLPNLQDYMINSGIVNAYQAVSTIDKLKEDSIPPAITAKQIFTKTKIQIEISVKDSGGSKLRVVKYAAEKKDAAYFERGTEGTSPVNNLLATPETGDYTIYASDYAGNESTLVLPVLPDKTAPAIKTSVQKGKTDKSSAVAIHVTDIESGVKSVTYQKGILSASEMKKTTHSAPISIEDGKGSFTAASGTYTIYAVDYFHNAAIKTIHIP